jgi:hypothetical protein
VEGSYCLGPSRSLLVFGSVKVRLVAEARPRVAVRLGRGAGIILAAVGLVDACSSTSPASVTWVATLPSESDCNPTHVEVAFLEPSGLRVALLRHRRAVAAEEVGDHDRSRAVCFFYQAASSRVVVDV